MPIAVADEFVAVAETLMVEAAPALVAHRNDSYPHEAVGIVCSDGSTYPLINQARSGHRFEVSEVLVQEAITILSERGLQPVAVYHSHPESVSGPSNRDISMMQHMPGALSIIVGKDGIAAWLWNDGLQSVGKVQLPERVEAV